MTTLTLHDQLLIALIAADIATDDVRHAPDDTYYVDRTGTDGRIAFGLDEIDEAGTQWWIATVYDANDSDIATINATDLGQFARDIAGWV